MIPLGVRAGTAVVRALRANQIVGPPVRPRHRRRRRRGRVLRRAHHPARRPRHPRPPHEGARCSRPPSTSTAAATTSSSARRCRSKAPWPTSPNAWPPSSRASSAAPPTSGTCSSPTGHPTAKRVPETRRPVQSAEQPSRDTFDGRSASPCRSSIAADASRATLVGPNVVPRARGANRSLTFIPGWDWSIVSAMGPVSGSNEGVARDRWLGSGRSAEVDAFTAGSMATREAVAGRDDGKLLVVFCSEAYDLDALLGGIALRGRGHAPDRVLDRRRDRHRRARRRQRRRRRHRRPGLLGGHRRRAPTPPATSARPPPPPSRPAWPRSSAGPTP